MKSLLLLLTAMLLPFSFSRLPKVALAQPEVIDQCKCSQSQDALPTHPSVKCHVSTPCIIYSVATSGAAGHGSCFKEEVCGATATRCAHESYIITLNVGSCAADVGTGCCATTRPAQDGPPPVPAGSGCMKVKVNGTDWGIICLANGQGEGAAIPVGAPPLHLCGQPAHQTTIEVECPETGGLIFELTVKFRCAQCPAIANDG